MVPHKTRVKMVKIRVRLTCDWGVWRHIFSFQEWQAKNGILPDLSVKISSNNDEKITNTVIKSRQCLLDFCRICITWLYWTKYFMMLCLHRFCYFAVSFAIFWRLEFIKRSWCLINISIICIGVLYFWSIRGF